MPKPSACAVELPGRAGAPMPDTMVDAARRQVCARAATAGEAGMLLDMLGIGPATTDRPRRVSMTRSARAALVDRPRPLRGPVRTGDQCAGHGCERVLRANGVKAADAPGTVSHMARGMCSACWKAARAAEAEAGES